MTKVDRIKEYMELCNIESNRQLHLLSGYPKSVQYLGQILNEQKPMNEEEERLIYKCINIAQAKRIMGYEE